MEDVTAVAQLSWHIRPMMIQKKMSVNSGLVFYYQEDGILHWKQYIFCMCDKWIVLSIDVRMQRLATHSSQTATGTG